MRNSEDGASVEMLPDGCLYERVRLGVHVGRRLVQHQDAVVPDYGPREAHQLSLAYAEVGPALWHLHVQYAYNPRVRLWNSTTTTDLVSMVDVRL